MIHNKKGIEMAAGTIIILIIVLIVLVISLFFIAKFVIGPTSELASACGGDTEYSSLSECNDACKAFCRSSKDKEGNVKYCCIGGKKTA